MTDRLLPAGLAGLPTPWNLTSDVDRRAALAGGSHDAAAVLDRVLGELPGLLLAEPDDEELPGDLGEFFDFTAAGLAEAIPVLDGVTVSALTALVREWTGEEPDPAGATALGRRWLAHLARQLEREAVAATPPGELAGVLRRHLARLAPGTAGHLLLLLGPVREGPLLELLKSVAVDASLAAEVRDEARGMLVAVGKTP